MSEEIWATVDDYLTDTLVRPDPSLAAAVEAGERAGLPQIQVSAPQGKLLHLLALIRRAETILELGTLAGYSTIWLASALPRDGRMVTLELEEKHAAVARENLTRAGLADKVEIRVGPAASSLEALVAEGAGPFDLVFIDADKSSYPDYFRFALRLSAPGSVIVVDNVVRQGEVANSESKDEMVVGVRRMNEILAAESRVSATVIQTVGQKGYDGFTLALVR